MSELTLDRIIEHIVGRRSRGFSDVRRLERLARRAAARSFADSAASASHETSISRSTPARWSALRACSAAAAARWPAFCSGSIRSARAKSAIKGAPVEIKSPVDAIANGLALVPEDRLRQGLVLEHSVEFNTSAFHPRPARLVAVRVVRQGQRSRGPADRGPPDQDRLARGRRSARSPAETSRRSSSASGSTPSRTSSSSTSRPAASTSARRPRSSRSSAISPRAARQCSSSPPSCRSC